MIPSFSWPVKDNMGLRTPGVPCECGQGHIGQTGHFIESRVKKHQCHIHLEYPDISATAKHSINLSYYIHLQNITKPRYMDQGGQRD
jgi:hypothetical protein